MELYYEHKNDVYKVEIEPKSDVWEIHVKDRVYQVSASEFLDGSIHIVANNSVFRPRVFSNGRKRFIFLNGETYCLKRAARSSGTHDHVEGEVISPIGGKIVRVYIAEGGIVEKGQDLFIIESMKMEHRVKSPVRGTIMRIRFGEGAVVDTNEVLVDIERDKTTNGQAEW